MSESEYDGAEETPRTTFLQNAIDATAQEWSKRFEAAEITVPFRCIPGIRVLVHPDLAKKWAKELAEKHARQLDERRSSESA